MRTLRVRIRKDDWEWLTEERLRRDVTTAELLHEILEFYREHKEKKGEFGESPMKSSPLPPETQESQKSQEVDNL